MLSPSDFNNAVPQFTNGNYASNPINPKYVAEPDAENYNKGTEPLQTLPAQWWNWFINKFTARFNKVNIYVKNIFNELAQVLSIFNITPDGTEATPTTSQLKTVFESCYPQYVKQTANLVGTETTVNGHPLSSNVTVTKSDLGLGTSATLNTGTAVGCIPTVGTALGTTNNNILVTDSTGKLKPSGITVGTAAGCDATFFAKKTELNALYGNIVGTPLGTAAVGTCTTFARSDHVHPISCTLIGEGVTIKAECNNEMNVRLSVGTTMWFNYRGNTSLVCIGDGSGQGTLGSIAAANFCGNLCGLSQCAHYIFHDSFFGDADRNVMIANESGAKIYGCIGTSQNCPLKFNPATGVLTANCFCGDASQAGKSYSVGDFTQPSTSIYLGHANAGLTCSQIDHLAAFSTTYENGKIVIKDASKEVIQSWLGLGTAAYRNEGDLCVSCATNATCLAGRNCDGWTKTCFGCFGSSPRYIHWERSQTTHAWHIYTDKYLDESPMLSIEICNIGKAICCAMFGDSTSEIPWGQIVPITGKVKTGACGDAGTWYDICGICFCGNPGQSGYCDYFYLITKDGGEINASIEMGGPLTSCAYQIVQLSGMYFH